MERKKLKDLTIRDNFMFTAVMSEEANCKPFLEMLLRIEIDRVEVSYEKSRMEKWRGTICLFMT